MNSNPGGSAEVISSLCCSQPSSRTRRASQGPHRPPAAFQSLFQPVSFRQREKQGHGREMTHRSLGDTRQTRIPKTEKCPVWCGGGGISATQTVIGNKFTKQQELLPHKKKIRKKEKLLTSVIGPSSLLLENGQKCVPSGKECWGRQPCPRGVTRGVTFLLKTDGGVQRNNAWGEGWLEVLLPPVGTGGWEERKGMYKKVIPNYTLIPTAPPAWGLSFF